MQDGYFYVHKQIKYVNDGYYTPQIVEKFISEKIDDYRNEKLPHKKLSILRKTSEYLRQYYESGKLEHFRLPTLGHSNLNSYFESVVRKYEEIELQRGVIAPHVIEARKKTISNFLCFFQNKGHQTFNTVKPCDIHTYLFKLSQKQPKGIISTLPIIRKFCTMLNDSGIHKQNWDVILNVKRTHL